MRDVLASSTTQPAHADPATAALLRAYHLLDQIAQRNAASGPLAALSEVNDDDQDIAASPRAL